VTDEREELESQPRTPRGTETRALILETALALFKEKGYEETTMRAIAERAGVAIGNASYYFKSKEHLIQAFYGRIHEEHMTRCAPLLAKEKDLGKRLRSVMSTKLETMEPYHQFAGILFRTAADPASPLNPFSPESQPVRREVTELFARVLEGSRVKVPPDLAARLPDLLWTYHMGIVLAWIHDTTPGRARSRILMEHTVDIVARLVKIASVPVLRPVRRRVLLLLEDLEKAAA
jgi:AcrR family transcriptional regulator